MTHEDFFDPEPPVTDPAEDGLAPDDCMITVDVSECDAAVAAIDVAVLVTVAHLLLAHYCNTHCGYNKGVLQNSL